MPPQIEETILAPATPPGSAQRGIIRISGPASWQLLATRFIPLPDSPPPAPWTTVGSLFPWSPSRPVPAKLFYWPPGRGYTGQSSVEVHTLANPPLLDAIVNALLETRRARLAHPGEFTMRAFLAGRLDLTRAEAVLAVIDADSRPELQIALRQLAGNLALPLQGLREKLLDLLAHLEAGMDFAEEEIEFVSRTEIRQSLRNALAETNALLHRIDSRGQTGHRPLLLLLGPPNAGKSTLFNALLKNNHAIVSPVPGTTRDYLEAEIELGDWKCRLIDSAGLTPEDRHASEIDRRAQEKARDLAARADLVLLCEEADAFSNDFSADLPFLPENKTLRIRTKTDRHAPAPLPDYLDVSVHAESGLDELSRTVVARLDALFGRGEVVPGTALRCRNALAGAADALRRAHAMTETDEVLFDESLLAAEIRDAANRLGLIDGSLHTEDILDRIFSRFCIGK